MEGVRQEDLATNARILLVEDEIIVAMDVQQRLESLGYSVVANAVTGEEALGVASAEPLDLILMDIKIRGAMDGIETAIKLRETLDIPIVYLTAFADEKTLKRARVTEAYGYLIKPFEDRELRSTIEMALYKYKIEHKLRESEERYALATRASNGGIWDWNLRNDQVYYSARWAEMLGLEPERLDNTPATWLERVHPEDYEPMMQALSAHVMGAIPIFESEYRIRHQDGRYRWMRCRGLALFDSHKQPYRLAGSQDDITDRKRYEQELMRKALHDDLTGLHNRALFTERLNNFLTRLRYHPELRSIMLFLDLDHFKDVNDSFGHGWGDDILVQVAHRLQNSLHPSDTIARFGGDEFAILLDQVEDVQTAQKIADRILEQLSAPFLIQGKEIFVTGSVGLLQIDANYQSTEDIFRDVDIAMYSAKRRGRARYEIFHQELREKTVLRLDKVFEIRRGLENQEFVLYYQPIFSLPEKDLSGFEALIRWQHPTKGLILPAEFIPVAEETRLIIPLGEWVLRAACRQAQTWNASSGRELKIAVNVSRHQLLDDSFISYVESSLLESGLPARLLELEITESVAMENVDITMRRFEELEKLGVNVAIDDFGSGYSSMDHLKRFPARTLKIDRSFVHEMNEDDKVIVSTIINMAHQLRLKAIAEGVETEQELAELTNLSCDQVQGFFLGKTLHPDAHRHLVERDNPTSGS